MFTSGMYRIFFSARSLDPAATWLGNRCPRALGEKERLREGVFAKQTWHMVRRRRCGVEGLSCNFRGNRSFEDGSRRKIK
jgi:hypothetical protein